MDEGISYQNTSDLWSINTLDVLCVQKNRRCMEHHSTYGYVRYYGNIYIELKTASPENKYGTNTEGK